MSASVPSKLLGDEGKSSQLSEPNGSASEELGDVRRDQPASIDLSAEDEKKKGSSDSDFEVLSSRFSLLCGSEGTEPSAEGATENDSAGAKDNTTDAAHSEKPKAKRTNKKADNARREAQKQGKKQARPAGEARNGGPLTKEATVVDDIYRVMYRFLRPQEEIDSMYRMNIMEERKKHSLRKRVGQAFGIVARKPTWPTYRTTGMYMEQVESKNGAKEFVFKHNKAYRQKESEFLRLVSSPDPRYINIFLRSHPYHVNSMIQCSEILYWREDVNSAQDMIEMAMYSLENSFHTCFTITGGECRLDYSIYENRALYIVLFTEVVHCLRHQCRRSALEYCKLIFCLDRTDDPLAVILIIDYLYLLNGMYDTVIELEGQFDTDRCLDLLPNIKYSVALALFLKAEGSGAAADLRKADEKLYAALIQFPTVVPALLDKLQVIPEGSVLKCPYFGAAEREKDGKGLQILIEVYAQRSWKLWQKDSVLAWLKAGVDRFASKYQEAPPEMLTTLEIHAAVRKAQYFRCPRPVYRHIFLSKTFDIPMPSEAVFAFNPFPPNEEDARLTMQNEGQSFVPRSWMFINLDMTMDALLGKTLMASRQLFELIGSISSRRKHAKNKSSNGNNNNNNS